MHTTSHLLMIRPVSFGFNEETAVNNSFQIKGMDDDVQYKALKEFDAFVQKLSDAGVDVTVVDDTLSPHTPDSIFPNNWISFHDNGTVILYPMFAENRRAERKPHVLETIKTKFSVNKIIDLTSYEAENKFLEGTGSMVPDRGNKIVYACLSPRTSEDVLKIFCGHTGYKPCTFFAADRNGDAVYHTNVMMCMADNYAVICMECISDESERTRVKETLLLSGKEIIEISFEQMNHFAGNMLQVMNADGEKILVMSSQAYHSLKSEQIKKLESYNRILHSSLETIETNGGGSARCMMAEVFLPVNV